VGLTYFRGDRFRGRVVVEYGEPILIGKDLVQQMRENKRKAYVTLLAQVEEGMRSVIVTATDYNELKLLHAVRRLYQRSALSTLTRQDLSHRFATALRLLKEKYNGSFPTDMQDLQSRIQVYQDTLDNWNLKDHQITRLEFPDKSKILFSFIYLLVVALLASVPTIFLNAPVGLAAKFWAEAQAKKDLKKSRVKLQARDVVLTKKIMFCLVAVPTLWISYALLLYFFSSLEPRVILALFLCMPVFSYIGVTAMEAGAVKLNDLKPAFLRLLPGFQKQAELLPTIRAQLVKDVRAIVKKYGPDLGPVYFEKSLQEWEKSYKKT